MAANAKLTKTNDLGFFEIRLESIGGLGANLAGKMLAEAGVIRLGFNGSNFSAYGSEKKGSPVKSYVRFANPETSIRDSSPIEEPHVVAVFHEALFRTQNCSSGLKEDGVLIVNTKRTPDEIREQTGLQSGTIVCVDALGISVDEKTRINTAMLGTLCRIVDFLDPDAIRSMISDTFIKKYPALVESNIRTFDRGFEEVNVKTYELTEGQHVVPFVRRSHDLCGILMMEQLTVLALANIGRRGHMTKRRRIRKLRSCVHVTFIIVLKDDHFVIAKRSTDRRTHADIHTAITSDHDERDIITDRNLATAFPF